MELYWITFGLTVLFAVIFQLANGWNDAANAVATVISTRVLTPAKAIVFGAVLNFVGALFSSKVAETVGKDIAKANILHGVDGATIFLAAVVTAPIWITFCSRRGLPNSCSHALLGALIGSVIAATGDLRALNGDGIKMIFFGVLIGPLAGFVAGYILARVVTWISRDFRPNVAAPVFGRLQLVSAGAMAFAHGTGDAQKAMGIIAGALVSLRIAQGQTVTPDMFHIDMWMRIACALAMALGTCLGGWAVMKTLGSRLIHLRTYQGFSAETAAATTILCNTLVGVPMSTTHSITGAILGVGSARRIKAVRWGVGKKIVFAWVVTFPVCILVGAGVFLLLRLIGLR
jgi:PiT family inorganic phosphate transporter